MAEILISLNLKTRSGTLAKAITTLRQSGLEFQSHQLSDPDDSQRRLVLNAAGELTSFESLADELTALRGVESIQEIRIDGQPLVDGQLPGESGSPAAEVAPVPVEPDPVDEPAAEAAVEQEARPEPAESSTEAEAQMSLAAADIQALRKNNTPPAPGPAPTRTERDKAMWLRRRARRG